MTASRQQRKRAGKPHPALADISRDWDDSIPINRLGRGSAGLYPDVSRTKLAHLLGVGVDTATRWLNGRQRMPIGAALVLARCLGIGMEELHEQLQRQRKRRGQRQ